MKNKKISYTSLTSDLYLLLSFSYIIYGLFFDFERIGRESFQIIDITRNNAIKIGLIEIIFCIYIAYMLHRCDIKQFRIIVIIISIINIIYRIINIIIAPNAFTILMLILSILLILNLLFY